MSYKDAIAYTRGRLENNITSYPISLPQFNNYIGGISEEEMYLFFGGTGTSKTKCAIKLFVIDLVNYVFQNKDKDIQIYYFTLELSTVEIYLNIFCHLLHLKTGKYYSVKYFKNKTDKRKLDFTVFEEFELVKDWLELLDQKVKIIDFLRTPTQIYNGLKKHLDESHGKIVTEGDKKYYKKNNPNKLILVITDTINAFKNEQGMNKYDTIDLWCANYCKQELKMFYKCVILNLQQMDKSSSTSQYTNKGERIEEKYVPTIESLQHHKSTNDHHTTVFSIFNPSRHKLGSFEGFDINVIGNNFRRITILKNSHGDEQVHTDFYINNAYLLTEELEDPRTNPAGLYKQLLKYGIEDSLIKKYNF
jgi:hypothetical protein